MFRRLCVLAVAASASTAPLLAQQQQQQPEQRTFQTPQEALEALVEATAAQDRRALAEIFGPEGRELFDSGDPVEDRRAARAFAAAAMDMARLVRDPAQPGERGDRFVVVVGRDNWPFPVPIVQEPRRGAAAQFDAGDWRFDTAAGKEELINRRIGRNELLTIEVVRAYVDAQREYAMADHDGDEVLEYATRFISEPGTRNGLYWPSAPGERQSPIGPLMARAAEIGYEVEARRGGPRPFNGYLFRILTSQGPEAPGGAYDYLINGNMVAGFALVATPVDYGSSGIMTFLVGPNGVIYERDLGEDSESLAGQIRSFNPDPGWRRTQD